MSGGDDRRLGGAHWRRANEQEKRGHELYTHYCSDCHGKAVSRTEGFNWSSMRIQNQRICRINLRWARFKDEELFVTISRDMLDTTEEGGDPIGDDDFAVPTMPTFKYTLSEDEVWAIVGHVRTLHGMKMEFNVAARKTSTGRRTGRSHRPSSSKAKQAYEAAERKPVTKLSERVSN
ncbi:MAG: c-type cytochrome [Nitrospira sp.]|nr:c-type cytochrome [Nitrospira sp.]